MFYMIFSIFLSGAPLLRALIAFKCSFFVQYSRLSNINRNILLFAIIISIQEINLKVVTTDGNIFSQKDTCLSRCYES